MFWLNRLKSSDQGTHWSLPYGDLMSLLLAVFVLIAAMSELKAGPRYSEAADSVRGAFGFSARPSEPISESGVSRPLTLVKRLERAGLQGASMVRLDSGTDEALAPCEILAEPGRLVIRIPGSEAFEPFGTVLQPDARRLVARLADYLAGGKADLEVRGHAGDGAIPADVALRDGWDLSYERARAVAQLLVSGKVSAERIRVVALGDSEPLASGGESPDAADKDLSETEAPGLDPSVTGRRIEIVVSPAGLVGGDSRIAEKERNRNGGKSGG